MDLDNDLIKNFSTNFNVEDYVNFVSFTISLFLISAQIKSFFKLYVAGFNLVRCEIET